VRLRIQWPKKYSATLAGFVALLVCAFAAPARAERPSVVQARDAVPFQIAAGPLVDALNSFGDQSGLQVVYDLKLIAGRNATAVSGHLRRRDALDRLLAGSGVAWKQVNEMTVMLVEPGSTRFATRRAESDSAIAAGNDEVVALGDVAVSADPLRLLPNSPSISAFGLSKLLMETPRSVSAVSAETIDLFGLSAVEDLVRLVPGTFTTTRFGIQGSVDVRNVPADFYFRGMKRLSLQGHGRSVLGALDTIEVVRGPPSPIFGMGKIGGYVNVEPTSGRAQNGSYIDGIAGFGKGVIGSYDRSEWSFGVGGSLDAYGRRGGYYLHGLFEDSNSFAHGVPVKQQLLQAAVSIDDVAGPVRLELGVNTQVSRTAGALTGRLTQDLVDRGRYIRGEPLINLDLNGNGAIGWLEMNAASPVRGNLSAANQPLIQYFAWPRDAEGRPLPVDQFPQVAGIPQSLYDYLVAHPEADPTGMLRAQGPGGPQPMSGHVPLGMFLDPRTTGFDTLDTRRATAFERDLEARFVTLFADLIYDSNPDFTVANQLFYDRMDQYKASDQPFAQDQTVYVFEDRLTVTRRLGRLPSSIRARVLAAVNYRKTVADGSFFNAGDFSTHRTDAMARDYDEATAGMNGNTTFANPYDNAGLDTDGYPWTSIYASEFSEMGAGLMLDADIHERTNLLLGVRVDGSHAHNTDFAAFNPNTGTSANPGAYATAPVSASGWDSGVSWSASVSHSVTPDIRPYLTVARASVALDGNNNSLTNAIIGSGHIGESELRELGVKASLLADKLFATVAMYRQRRVLGNAEPQAVIGAYATATLTRGVELEVKWVPVRNSLLSLYALRQETRFAPNLGSALLVDARTLGFQDVVDAAGNVIYPAEAFMYGGRTRLVLPADVPQFATKQGNPRTQLGLSTQYQMRSGVGITLSGNYFSSVCSGRLCRVELPAARVIDAGVFWDARDWHFKLDVLNALDERYYRARTGDALGDALAQAMPARHWQLTLKRTF
jgi:outer membrane receptor protein involved in Fe transport